MTTLALAMTRRLMRVIEPVWLHVLTRRLRAGKETAASIAQKTMKAIPSRPDGILIWGHAVGVGEVLALGALFRRLGELRPDVSFLITSSARSSADVLASGNLPPRCVHQFAPIDTPRSVGRFFDHWRPDYGIWCEMDLWPVLLDECDRRGVRRALVNARLSERSRARRRWGAVLYRALFARFESVWAQNESSASGLIEMGARPESVVVTGTLKTLAIPLPVDQDELLRWKTALGQRPVWLFASSHAGEELLALTAHQALRVQFPEALLIIAPRYPARGATIVEECPTGTLRRSANRDALPLGDPVYVADTLGEMGLWYRLSSIALVGGSLVPVGGHNPYEALALGCSVLHGPNVDNFAESYRDLDQNGVAIAVLDTQSLIAAVRSHWQRPKTTERLESPSEPWSQRIQSLASRVPRIS